MLRDIRNLIANVLEDAKEIRENGAEAKERLPIEIMALNAVVNAYEKINQVLPKSATPDRDD